MLQMYRRVLVKNLNRVSVPVRTDSSGRASVVVSCDGDDPASKLLHKSLHKLPRKIGYH